MLFFLFYINYQLIKQNITNRNYQMKYLPIKTIQLKNKKIFATLPYCHLNLGI